MDVALGGVARPTFACMTPRVSIIIPTYNHGHELIACLRSLERQSTRDFEVIVVDDASTDQTERLLHEAGFSFPVGYHRFSENRGAPAARNEGFRRTTAPYVLFLDADAELVPDALDTWVQTLDAHPEAAFAYASFRFGFKTFRGRPFDPDALREKNYIHTSALIRRSVHPHFDEALKKFQDWDLFLTLAEAGHRGIWIDRVLFTLKPRDTGMSRWLPKIMFQIPWDMVGYTPHEVRRYRVAEEIVLVKHRLRAPDATKREQEARQGVKRWFVGILVVELVSRWVIFSPTANAIAAVSFACALFALTVFRPSAALAVLLTELVIGSKGALFKIGGDANNDGGISIRILLFFAFFLGWFVLAVRERAWQHVQVRFRMIAPYIALAGLVGYGLVRGIQVGNDAFLMADANAWAFWALVIPVVHLVQRDREEVARWITSAVLASVVWLGVKTLFLLYFFGHGFLAQATGMYLWVRRTGVGEITRVAGNAFRIFFQSHIFTVPALIAAFSWFAAKEKRQGWVGGIVSLSLATVLISLSRSMWIGLAGGFVVAGVLARVVVGRWPWFAVKRFAVGGMLAIGIMGFLLAVPLPPVDPSSLFGVLGSRANTGEAAAVSRWRLLEVLVQKIQEAPVLGHGFGATVTYESKDPRIVAETGGLYTTPAFEWGWLEHWVKFGALGIPVMAWMLISVTWRVWVAYRGTWIAVASVASLAALALVHVFTPYLNHPLGIVYLLFVEGMIAHRSTKQGVLYS